MKPEKLREGYVGWAPGIDYMEYKKDYPDSPNSCKRMTAEKFIEEWIPLDPEYNQIIDFYFLRATPVKKCLVCDGEGYNPATKRLSDNWYTHLRTDGKSGWSNRLEKEEVKALWEKGRLWHFKNRKQIPTPQEVNERYSQGMGHDAINHWICVEIRAKKLGIWGHCGYCKGRGSYPTGPEYLGLNLWMTHPRKGTACGIEITNIKEILLPIFYKLLWEMGQRLNKRFKNVPEGIYRGKLFKEGFPDIAGIMCNPR